MRAFSLPTFGGPAALEIVDREPPELEERDDTAIVDVKAIGINFPDLLAIKGMYQDRLPLPFVPGCEVAGTIAQVGSGQRTSRWQPGDSVAAYVERGGYAEQAEIPLQNLTPLPDGVDFATGAAMVINTQTVTFALLRRGGLREGERLLVLGAGGGIGTAAIQVGRAVGAEVYAGVAGEQQAETALAAGANDVVVLEEGFGARINERTDGKGVDVVIDPLGDWLFTEATRCMAPGGRILVVGFAAGDIPSLKVNRLLLRNISAVGVWWGGYLERDPSIVAEGSSMIANLLEAGVRPVIDSRSRFEELPVALERLERGEIAGKAVVELVE